MKIGLFIERYDPAGGGAERSTAQIARELAQRGHQVTILAGSAPTSSTDEGVTVRAMRAGHSSGVIQLWQFARWAQQQRKTGDFDVTMSVTTAVAADVLQPRSGTMRETFARNVAMRPTFRSKQSKRLSLLFSAKHQSLLALERKTLADESIRQFVAVSEYVVDQLATGYGIARERIEVIPNAASLPPLTDEQRQTARDQIRRSFRIGAEQTAFLFLAHNPRLKGFNTLVNAAHHLHAEGRDFVVFLAGLQKYAHNVRIARAGLRDHFRMVGPTRQVAQLYCAADVTVHPTWYDPSSKVVIESLMMGVPAITTRFNGAVDVMRGKAGEGVVMGRVLDDPGDSIALATAMVELMDRETRQTCAIDRIKLAEVLSMKRHAESLEKVLAKSARTGE